MKYTQKYIKNLNKKGQVQYFLESAFRIGFLMVALLAFFLLVNFYIVNRIDTNRLQAEVTANRIIYSDAIMWQDNSRVYPGIIDINKFNDDTLGRRIDYATKSHAAAQLKIIDNKDGTEKYPPAYLNKAQYENFQAIIGKEGKGSATMYTKDYPITYRNGDESNYGTLIMNIIIPNS